MIRLVELEGIEKSHGSEHVLRGASLAVGEGEWVSLVGRSGSGKSTLLSIVGGLDRHFTGRARVCDAELAALDDRGLATLRGRELGFVFQAFHLLDHLTVEENVLLPSYFTGRGASTAARARAKEALDHVGMAAFCGRRPGALSGGQRQRIAIARALYRAPESARERPRLLLADEPTGNLDAETGDEILELFARLHHDGLTLLVVTHEERACRAATRVVRLDHGRVVDVAPGGDATRPSPAGAGA